MTKREMYVGMLGLLTDPELDVALRTLTDPDFDSDFIKSLKDKISGEIDRLDVANANKASKPTKRQRENAEYSQLLYDVVPHDKSMTVTEIANIFNPYLDGTPLSVSRVTRLCMTLCEQGRAVNERTKKTSYYKIGGEEV